MTQTRLYPQRWFRAHSLRSARLTLAFQPKSDALNSTAAGRCGRFHVTFQGRTIGAVSLIGTTPTQAVIGYEIKPELRRRGLAAEAVAALTNAAPGFGLKRLSAHCRSDNTASRGVLEKNGFALVSSAPWQVNGDSSYQFMVYEWTAPETT